MGGMPTFTSVEDAVRALYDGPAATFVAARKALAAQAKAAGDSAGAREIAALRKPTAAAEAVNHLDEDELREMLGVGAALRAAQTRLDTAELKRLTSERQRLLDAAVAKVDGSAALRDEVRSTLLAATSDVGAEAAVRSRALVRGLQYSGWGEVHLDDALAHRDAASRGRGALRVVSSRETQDVAPAPAHVPSAAEQQASRRRDDIIAAEADVAKAEQRLRAATAAHEAAKSARASARSALEDARARLENARTS